MALPTGSGTETIHTHMFSDLDSATKLIIGSQHHVYTVLSISIYCLALNATTDVAEAKIVGWESHGGLTGASGGEIIVFKANPQVGETFVWNDKFSFNGYEPTGLSGIINNAAYQTALAAQGGSVAQYLEVTVSNAADNYDVIITYIDQDWS